MNKNDVNKVDEGLERVFLALNGPSAGWDLRTTPPFPDRWPLSPAVLLSTYAFAYRADPSSPRVMVASKPFAIATANLALQNLQLGATPAIEVAGIQGVIPIAGTILAQLQALPPFAVIFQSAQARPPTYAECDALAARYQFFRQCHGLAYEAVRHRHLDLFAWLDAKE